MISSDDSIAFLILKMSYSNVVYLYQGKLKDGDMETSC